jgi:hypothetical protein
MHRHLVMFASLFLLLWAAISVGCSSKSGKESAIATSSNSVSLPEPKEVTLPAGTAVIVRLFGAVGSKLSANGDHFRAIVARPVEVHGKVVVPAGADALGRVVAAVPQGRFKDAAELRLVLETVTLNKDTYNVQTSSVNRYQKGKGKRTATLIGAALGAGARTAGAADTGEKEIVLPAESALSFTLTQPVSIKM